LKNRGAVHATGRFVGPFHRRGASVQGFRTLRRWLGWALALATAALQGETLTVATYNVENYVAADRMTESGYRREYPKPEAQKSALRHVLCRLNADILVLQEMGGAPYLEELRRDLKSQGLDYPHTVLLEAADPDRHVALMCKLAPMEVTRHTALDFDYFGGREKVKRGLLEARFATRHGELTIFGLHLKSRFTDRPDDPRSMLRRLGEAVAIRDEVLRRFRDPGHAQFLILGDCNDDRASKRCSD